MKWSGVRLILLPLTVLLSMAGQILSLDTPVTAAESPVQQPTSPFGALDFTSRKEPIHINSHDLEFFYNEKRIVYRGSVVATQGDATLKSNKLTITYEDAAKPVTQVGNTAKANAGQKIKEIIAEENVEITSENRRATCNKAVFSDATRTIVLTGNAVLRDEASQVTGQKVTIYVDEGRSTVEGEPRVVFTPKPEEKEQKGGGKQ